MFKNLKSKLEDEAKRLQITMSQYGDNIAQQVRSGAVIFLKIENDFRVMLEVILVVIQSDFFRILLMRKLRIIYMQQIGNCLMII